MNVNILIMNCPGPDCDLVEVEVDGKSISFGTWITVDELYPALSISPQDMIKHLESIGYEVMNVRDQANLA